MLNSHLCLWCFPKISFFFFLIISFLFVEFFFNHHFRKCVPATGLCISLHLRRSWCSLHYWRIFSLGMELWVISSFLLTLENCCSCYGWPPWFLMRNPLSFKLSPPRVKVWGLRDWRRFWSSVFSYLVVVCFSVDSLSLFCYIKFTVSWPSRFTFLVKSEKFSAILSLNFFFSILPSFFSPSRILMTHILDIHFSATGLRGFVHFYFALFLSAVVDFPGP